MQRYIGRNVSLAGGQGYSVTMATLVYLFQCDISCSSVTILRKTSNISSASGELGLYLIKRGQNQDFVKKELIGM